MSDPLDMRPALQVFFPYMHNRQAEVQKRNGRFVHYTNADAAMSILRNKEVWMRNSTCMNDIMEVEHGMNCVAAAYNKGSNGKRFQVALDHLFDGLSKELQTFYNDWRDRLRTSTYFTCFSEHYDTEDTFGRLSMWRGYGGGTGVAFVMNAAPFFNESDVFHAYTSPVAYLSDSEFDAEFKIVVDGIEENIDLLRPYGREAIKNMAFNMLMFAALCTKHPGFWEEREWRILFNPMYSPSNVLLRDVRVIAEGRKSDRGCSSASLQDSVKEFS
ncbi:DUF2971 domain-containing protein [Ferrovibrio terrae]|uniref:DUF2971 domain-containing protein n=1 Tax=Ferrovibrio terrae TaxID=2594003 RepID=A0A516H6D7_9PROT|nr:DUF2971 domain-containing protein [Ferrovibrio terrae]QDO99328.1 DUF2971 domain-containing protein [Ferrovibrio terrae]